MKKIINGKRYDSDAAKKIGIWSPEEGGVDGVQTLHQKRTGEFFLFIDPKNGAVDGELRPITDEEAREWVEKHCDAETYEQLFNVVEDTAAADEIKAIRKSTGLTQVEFCKKYGIPRSTLQCWEGGINAPAPYVVELLKYRVEH